MARKITVTGSTGTIGSKLLDELTGEPDVWALARSQANLQKLAQRGFRGAHFDFADSRTFKAAVEGTHTLFLLRPYGMDAFIQSKRLIDAAADAGVAHIVHVSAHGAPWDATIGWIHLIDAYIAQSGIAYTHLRPGFFMDNVLAAADRRAKTLTHFFGEQPVGWIAAVDIARVAAAAIRDPDAHRNRIHALATESRSMADIAALIGEITGEPYRYAPAAADERAVAAFVARGRGDYFSRTFIEYMRAIAHGAVPEAAQVFDTVAALTGRPATTWRMFIQAHAKDFASP